MTGKSSTQNLPVNANLKRAFENAVRDIYEVGLTGKASRYRTPILHRAASIPSESRLTAEKRALTDAAKALAQLWKVSPSR